MLTRTFEMLGERLSALEAQNALVLDTPAGSTAPVQGSRHRAWPAL